MTFNEWWAGQNLPEESKGVALAAWYACQLYGERIVQPVGFTNTTPSKPIMLELAHGHQLDVIGEELGVTRGLLGNGVEADRSYRARLLQRHREKIREEHVLDAVPHEAHGDELDNIGARTGLPRLNRNEDGAVETDSSYRARLRQTHREIIAKAHGGYTDVVHICKKCGAFQ